MWFKKIAMDNDLIDMISLSENLSDWEKINFLKFIWYMTLSERRELISLL